MSYLQFAVGLRRFLNQPTRVGLVCIFIFTISIVLNGNMWRLWSLHRDSARIQQEISDSRSSITELSLQLKQAKDPVFIERQARDKLDLVGEHDLVFVFSDQ